MKMKLQAIFTQLLFYCCNLAKSEYFECSDEFSADFQLYGSCVTQKCGRFLVKTQEKDLEIIETIANFIFASEIQGKNATVAVADLASNQITLDKRTLNMRISGRKYQLLIEQFVDQIADKIRTTVQDIFHINAKLWIAK